jgi:hypothetical protein
MLAECFRAPSYVNDLLSLPISDVLSSYIPRVSSFSRHLQGAFLRDEYLKNSQ